ncbi:hypothetical protein BDW22DRAFT_1191546 [Trametopsis cervina]|nr:hypothetical protein BDW22DRAFT_1191546 [Trametopsis cervina]
MLATPHLTRDCHIDSQLILTANVVRLATVHEPMPMTNILDLNLDILHIIFTYLSQQSALSLAYTCKSFYALALPRVLHNVVLRPSRLPALEAFLLAKTRAAGDGEACHGVGSLKRQGYTSGLRWDDNIRFLRHLTIAQALPASGTVKSRSASWQIRTSTSLANILLRAHSLRTLSIDRAESACLLHVPLVHALREGLPKLTSLSLTHVGHFLLNRVLPAVLNRANIRVLRLGFGAADYVVHDVGELSAALEGWTNLYDLEISNAYFRPVHPGQPCGDPPPRRLPSVRALTLRSTTVPLSSLAAITPNLMSLTLDQVVDGQPGDGGRRWRYLDHVSASSVDLEALLGKTGSRLLGHSGDSTRKPHEGMTLEARKFPMHIRRLVITDWCGSKSPPSLVPYCQSINAIPLMELIAQAEPTVLTMPLTRADMIGEILEDLAKNTKELRYLEIQISLESEAGWGHCEGNSEGSLAVSVVFCVTRELALNSGCQDKIILPLAGMSLAGLRITLEAPRAASFSEEGRRTMKRAFSASLIRHPSKLAWAGLAFARQEVAGDTLDKIEEEPEWTTSWWYRIDHSLHESQSTNCSCKQGCRKRKGLGLPVPMELSESVRHCLLNSWMLERAAGNGYTVTKGQYRTYAQYYEL